MLALAASFVFGQQALSPAEIRQIARDAYVYRFSMLDNYRIQYAYFADPANLDPHLNVQPCALKFCHGRFQPHL